MRPSQDEEERRQREIYALRNALAVSTQLKRQTEEEIRRREIHAVRAALEASTRQRHELGDQLEGLQRHSPAQSTRQRVTPPPDVFPPLQYRHPEPHSDHEVRIVPEPPPVVKNDTQHVVPTPPQNIHIHIHRAENTESTPTQPTHVVPQESAEALLHPQGLPSGVHPTSMQDSPNFPPAFPGPPHELWHNYLPGPPETPQLPYAPPHSLPPSAHDATKLINELPHICPSPLHESHPSHELPGTLHGPQFLHEPTSTFHAPQMLHEPPGTWPHGTLHEPAILQNTLHEPAVLHSTLHHIPLNHHESRDHILHSEKEAQASAKKNARSSEPTVRLGRPWLIAAESPYPAYGGNGLVLCDDDLRDMSDKELSIRHVGFKELSISDLSMVN